MVKLRIGDISLNGQVEIVDEDKLCYIVKSTSRGASGLRTISKAILDEFVKFVQANPDSMPRDARNALSGESRIDKYEYGYESTIHQMAKMILDESLIIHSVPLSKGIEYIIPSQIIYYGAPGTGKSHTIKEKEEAGLHCIRTTFHPDSDYATFVGCYKPHRDRESGNLTYEFVEQAFLETYRQAWQNPQQEIALVIEEINRGNCAQIFGDIFQLLDRDDDGWSTYPIKADTDICDHLTDLAIPGYPETMAKRYGDDKAGYGFMALPPNMSLLATMNTSDQSLFPIDSAFKRRWDWTYMKIKNHPEENYKIKLSDTEYDWWEFIQRINEIIASMTSSADKQLGYFFCKAAGDGTISPETFVSKVIFYLWNDVFKDYGFEDASLFRYKNDKDEMKDLTFPDFYDEAGEKVNETRLKDFLDKVLNWKKDKEEQNN
jgi:hypothetical protein